MKRFASIAFLAAFVLTRFSSAEDEIVHQAKQQHRQNSGAHVAAVQQHQPRQIQRTYNMPQYSGRPQQFQHTPRINSHVDLPARAYGNSPAPRFGIGTRGPRPITPTIVATGNQNLVPESGLVDGRNRNRIWNGDNQGARNPNWQHNHNNAGNSNWQNQNGTQNLEHHHHGGGTGDWENEGHHHHWGDNHNWDRQRRDRGWWRSHYSRFSYFGGGCYYWDSGYWYPAYGYDPYFTTYTYDAPIYAYQDQDPGQVIANVQAALQRRGYDAGGVDGTYGPMTRRALLNYQGDNGLPVTGEIDEETLDSLGLR
ncbi:MAG: peptidoglycan-binding protein [Verrucomicrobiota bacterium]|nr:peptidoglycan-binding protein [Verrucomicrobiota bacterium]